MLARDSLELFTGECENEAITLDPEERQAIRRRLIRANELEKENKELREKLRRTQEELKRMKASAPYLVASDLTAEAGGVPSSRVFYRLQFHRVNPTQRAASPATPAGHENALFPMHRHFGRSDPQAGDPRGSARQWDIHARWGARGPDQADMEAGRPG